VNEDTHIAASKVADPDPNSAFHLNADPDLTFYFNADQDPNPAPQKSIANLRLQVYRPSRVPLGSSSPPL
jgi:hypothetical protein